MYHDGKGVKRNHQQALKLHGLAAEQGYADAQYSLGLYYHEGRGVQIDYVESVRWFELAAAQGHAGGQSMLGAAYDRGHGIAKNPVEMIAWYRLAVAQNRRFAQYCLGRCYDKGWGVPQDIDEAIRLFTLASDQGDVRARDRLGGLLKLKGAKEILIWIEAHIVLVCWGRTYKVVLPVIHWTPLDPVELVENLANCFLIDSLATVVYKWQNLPKSI